ncbi:hypothetical protein ACFP81_11560 [Deinococcus lacus]|uniref:Uncharacterized protein n=1 Tax=Deinococcus lacus TaxID=392561 RepID=A0ABW1Y8Z4_9DEIO
MRGLPRASVSVWPLEAAAAKALWDTRRVSPQQAPEGDLSAWLRQQSYSGFVYAPEGPGSFWRRGELQRGELPPGAALLVPVREPESREDLVEFWTQLVALTHRQAGIDETWRQASIDLAGQFPSLDPFARDIMVQTGELTVDSDVALNELKPALLSVYRLTLSRLGLRVQDLPLQALRGRPEWESSGLSRLEGGGA